MILNEIVINYKVLDLIILYNFDIKFDFIRDHMIRLWFFCVEPFVGAVMSSPAYENNAHFKGRVRGWPAPKNIFFGVDRMLPLYL